MMGGQKVKAVSPGALACQLLTDQHLEVTMDTATLTRPPFFNQFGPVGFGAGGIIVYGEECEIIDLLVNASGFFARESCGTCVPCREGTTWMHMMLRRMSLGGARPRDLDVLLDVATNISGRKTLCALGDFAVEAIGSAFIHFRLDLEEAVSKRQANGQTGLHANHAERQPANV